jgi:hypothetical protein
VQALTEGAGRDVLVIISASFIKALLGDDPTDDVRFAVVPHISPAVFVCHPDGVPSRLWALVSSATFRHGAVAADCRSNN